MRAPVAVSLVLCTTTCTLHSASGFATATAVSARQTLFTGGCRAAVGGATARRCGGAERGAVDMGLRIRLWPGKRSGKGKAHVCNYPHDEVAYRDRGGELLSIPQAERYSSSDWMHNIRTLPTSIILNRIKMPVLWQMVWATAIVVLNLWRPITVSMKPHTLLGSALGLLLVFRTNAAYNRFWEGRKIWESLLANSRDIARMGICYSDVLGRRSIMRIAQLLCVFPHILQEHLQGYKDSALYAGLVSDEELRTLATTTCNRPLLVVNTLAKECVRIPYGANWTSRERLTLIGMVNKLSQCIGACERLVQTPVPLHYVRHTSRFLTLWCFMLPLVLVSDMGWITVPIAGLSTWALFGIQEIGLLIEEPFSRSLKLEVFASTVYSDVMQTVGAETPSMPQTPIPTSEERAKPVDARAAMAAARADALTEIVVPTAN